MNNRNAMLVDNAMPPSEIPGTWSSVRKRIGDFMRGEVNQEEIAALKAARDAYTGEYSGYDAADFAMENEYGDGNQHHLPHPDQFLELPEKLRSNDVGMPPDGRQIGANAWGMLTNGVQVPIAAGGTALSALNGAWPATVGAAAYTGLKAYKTQSHFNGLVSGLKGVKAYNNEYPPNHMLR